MRVYLDSSAIVKRYVREQGSESVDMLYHALEMNSGTDHSIIFSSWNLGEAFGAIDSKGERGDIDKKATAEAFLLLVQETRKFVAMRKIRIVPVGSRVLTNSRELMLKYHIFQADALQIESAKQTHAHVFVASDRRLLEYAKLERLDTFNPERDHSFIEKKSLPARKPTHGK